MSQYLDEFIYKYASKGILLDTNIFIVYITGLYNPMYITTCDKTSSYTLEEFEFIKKFVANFHKIITTPHILAELTNISPKIREPGLEEYFSWLVAIIKSAKEEYIIKETILKYSTLKKFGFTDLSILEAARINEYLVLTDDFPLSNYLVANKCSALNFNHIRQLIWRNAV